MAAEKELENGQFASLDSSRSQLQGSEELEKVSQSNFRNGLHEIIFVWVVTSAHWITQANLGNTIVPIRYIAEGLGVPPGASARQSWFAASYSCTVGGFVLITGRLGDIYGHKNMFLIGWLWTTIWSIASGFAKDEVQFDIFRAMVGIGPSIMMPNAAALLALAWTQQWKKNLAFVVFGALAPAGFILGAGWGAGITETGVRWEWIYWSMAIVTAFYAVASWWVIPETGGMNDFHSTGFDVPGSVTGVAGLALIFIALNGGSTFGWDQPKCGIMLGIGVLSLALFCWIETKVKEPILPMSLFKSPTFVAVAVSLCLGWMSFGMFQFYLPHFLMELRGESGLQATLHIFPIVPTGIIATLSAVYFLSRVPGYIIFGLSMLCFFLGQLLCALTPVDQTYWRMSFPAVVVITFGPDLSFACGSLVASDTLKPEQQGVAGSFVSTIINYSIALGLSLAANIERGVNPDGAKMLEGFRAAWFFGAGCAALGMVMTAIFSKGMSKKHAH
ncbi:major facilitator superfamily domain-containing protein [Tuber borchii]|uniref:Major facilitator superfamily domain-containing protein n=1 Tax=Tuber borchii TaxID=42251 RepID=A0A2T6ZWV0_TUBBO|nr:major facilitator superfamily domain-containing protein [Tuber borchii]